jgi:hypothetical protein
LVALAILIVVIALAIVGFAVFALRSAGQSVERSAEDRSSGSAQRRPMPQISDFHVKGQTASVVFAVPLGDDEAGEHLTDLLAANAVEYVRQKVEDGLPLDGVHTIAVSAMRGDVPERLTTVELPDVGELPDEAPILRRDPSMHDPIAAVQAVAADASVATPSGRGDTLESVPELVQLSGPTAAHLRTMGVDTSTMGLEDLVVGLFRTSGYAVEPGRGLSMSSVPSGDTYSLTRGAENLVMVILSHRDGEYPELEDHVLAEFAVAVAQANPKRALLVTDKFSPYAMYERERRDKRLVFVTRERLQAFVDSFGLT